MLEMASSGFTNFGVFFYYCCCCCFITKITLKNESSDYPDDTLLCTQPSVTLHHSLVTSLHRPSFHFILLFYTYGCLFCMCICVPYLDLVCMRQKVLSPLDLELNELLSGCWISKMHPLKEQLLSAEPLRAQ